MENKEFFEYNLMLEEGSLTLREFFVLTNERMFACCYKTEKLFEQFVLDYSDLFYNPDISIIPFEKMGRLDLITCKWFPLSEVKFKRVFDKVDWDYLTPEFLQANREYVYNYAKHLPVEKVEELRSVFKEKVNMKDGLLNILSFSTFDDGFFRECYNENHYYPFDKLKNFKADFEFREENSNFYSKRDLSLIENIKFIIKNKDFVKIINNGFAIDQTLFLLDVFGVNIDSRNNEIALNKHMLNAIVTLSKYFQASNISKWEDKIVDATNKYLKCGKIDKQTYAYICGLFTRKHKVTMKLV